VTIKSCVWRSVAQLIDVMERLLVWLVFSFSLVAQNSIQVTSAKIDSPLCPTNCSCDSKSGTMYSSCPKLAPVHNGQLSNQFDTMLSSNLTYGLMTLIVSDTPLREVPASVCGLTTLKYLSLLSSRIVRLRDNCFTNLTSLQSLTISYNHITELQDGLFDGLHRLKALFLSYNRISSVGFRVFHSSANLSSLHYVTLRGNRIQTLEPWPYYVGANYTAPYFLPTVDLSRNNISTFTNTMGWKLKCGMRTRRFNLILIGNPIRHLSDLLSGWNMNLSTLLCLDAQGVNRSSTQNRPIDIKDVHLDCDCVDFNIIKVIFSTNSSFPKGVYCNSPVTLYNRQVNTIPLDQFVCVLCKQSDVVTEIGTIAECYNRKVKSSWQSVGLLLQKQMAI